MIPARFRRRLSVPAVALALASSVHAQAPRDLLAGHLSESQLASSLLSADAWHPYPTIDERAPWDAVPDSTRLMLIHAAERQLGKPWGSIPASVTLLFKEKGSRAEYDAMNTARRDRLAALVMAEVLENRGRFLSDIADGIWAISEQTFWGSTAHLGLQKASVGLPDVEEPVVELFAAEAAALLAWTDYLVGARLDRVSPLLRKRIRYEVDRRVLTPALTRDDFWWMGWGERKEVNNWNPWINSNWLASVLILERDPARRARAVYKIMRSLDNFLNIYPADGGCDEGPSYWNRAAGALFDNLELLRAATNGRVDIFNAPLVRNMGAYIYRAHIANDWYVNMSDSPARLSAEPELIYRFGQRLQDSVMQRFGAFLAQRHGARVSASSLGRMVPAVLASREIASAPAAEPLPGDVWFPDLQLMAARATPGSTRGLYVAAWGLHNGKSHNHNDVGNFIVYGDGEPVLVDVGVGTYTAQTFSARRYEIWTMQSAYHNLPTINGVMEMDGKRYHATDVAFAPSSDAVRWSADIAHAYPDTAYVTSWKRTVTLNRRANDVEIVDAYDLERATRPVRLSLMTPLRVDVATPGVVKLAANGRSYVIRYDAQQFRASAEDIPINDARLHPVWGDRITRIVLNGTVAATHGEYRVVVKESP